MNGLLASMLGGDIVLAGFIVFCRIGACLMVMPGISSARVPVRSRLFIALLVSAALLPVLIPEAQRFGADTPPFVLLRLMVGETLIGALIGTLARIFFLALETLATSIAYNIGLSANLGGTIDESLPIPALASLFTLGATMLLFASDQHWEILRGLVASYRAMPIASGFDDRHALTEIADTLSVSFGVALRIASPFILYALIVNLALGLVNRMVPQVPVYFISLPFVVAGGLYLLVLSIRQSLDAFMVAFSQWLAG